MTQGWKYRLEQARFLFSSSQAKSALYQLGRILQDIDALPIPERRTALRQGIDLFSKNGFPIEALTWQERAAALEERIDPRSRSAAVEFARLGVLHQGLSRVREARQALSRALRILEDMDPNERACAAAEEAEVREGLRKVEHILKGELAGRTGDSGRRYELSALLGLLERDVARLVLHPDVLAQQFLNSRVGEAPRGPSELRSRCRDYLGRRRGAWLELVRIEGPGRRSWEAGLSVRLTICPRFIRDGAVLPGGWLIFFADEGPAWTARPGERAVPFDLGLIPAERGDVLAAAGASVALIDLERTLWTVPIRYEGADPRPRESAKRRVLPRTRAVARREGGYLAVQDDGTLTIMDEGGETERRLKGAQKGASSIAATDDGRFAALGKNGASGSAAAIQIFDLETGDVCAEAVLDSYLHKIAATPGGDFLFACMDGLRRWARPWTSPPVSVSKGTDTDIVFSPGGRYMAAACGPFVHVTDLVGNVFSLLASPDGLSVCRLAFSDDEGNVEIHVFAGACAQTWPVASLAWRAEGDSRVLEAADFSSDGRFLAGLGSYGDRYLWDIAAGRLIESEKYSPGEGGHMLVEWTAGRTRGAVCQEEMIEIINAEGEFESMIDARYPFSPAWDGAGETLAFACYFDPVVRVVSVRPPVRSERYFYGEEWKPTAVALSGDGRWLAVGRSRWGPLRIPLSWDRGGTMRMDAAAVLPMEPELALIDRTTGRRTIRRLDVKDIAGLRFLEGTLLAVLDGAGQMLLLDIESGRAEARFWALSRIVRVERREGGILAADSGEGSVHEPIVYGLIGRNLKKGGPPCL